ncbi:UvrD-helicase domain-containing protein [uncultured Adlercreutzia sp.]|uniref:UvrD-helicase domain-containing protein n=1 Tax=uncultured Adlercreutzia sp. TaxID=875803 RepID=UPI00262E1C3B|nr:UvrD-helicase domain-containing protein [uncultured Adlercreutzia sp.]MCI9262099.1 UvrD-helicase domain-containing protein [Eggerthellaceae bacterium]
MNLDQCTDAQRRVITTLNAPLMVAAGAGSGKTFTLTQRVAFALSPQGAEPPYLASVDELLAITFTKKAAAELKSRIKGLLLAEGLVEEALKTDEAWVTTIHGMASRILREHALEIGIDPAFEVIEGTAAEELLDEALEQVIVQARRLDDPEVTELLTSEKLRGFGLRDKGVVEYVKAVLERVHAMPEGFATLQTAEEVPSPSSLMRRVLAAAEDMAAKAAAWPKPSNTMANFAGNLEAAVEQVRAWFERAGDESFDSPDFDPDAFCGAFYGLPFTMRGKLRDYVKEDLDAWCATLGELNGEAQAGLAVRWQRAIVKVALLVEEAFQELKGPARLDNTDLLVRCAAALRDFPAIAAAYRDKFKLIMVDEFQDTDRLQVEVISRLAQPGLANVCTVGDAQQSIYRFRGADVNVFTEYRANLEGQAGGSPVVSMARNFRSHGDVLAFVEHVFSQPEVFGDDFLSLEAGGAVNAVADPLFAERPRVQVDVTHNEYSGASKDEARAASAAALAEHFAALRDEGASAADMVILLGTMSHADVYAAALREQGIASMIAGGSVFASMPEPKLVSALLRMAVNVEDEEALYAVLASPLFAVSDDGLLALASQPADEGGWRRRGLSRGFRSPQLEDEMRVMGLSEDECRAVLICRDQLRAFTVRAHRGSPAAALRQLLVATGALDRLQAEGVDGLAAAANYAKALRIVSGLEAKATGLASVAVAFDAHLETAKEAPGALATAEGDFVRIMTVHASKGLEFPHVAIAELKDGRESVGRLVVENIGQATYASARFAPDDWKKVADNLTKKAAGLDEHERLEISALAPDEVAERLAALGPGVRHEALATFAQDQALAEARRLLYVALTRASKSLFVAVLGGGDPSKGYENAGIFNDLYQALQWDVTADASVSMADYGGTAPARVALRYLRGEQFEEEEDSASDGSGEKEAEAVASCDAATDAEATEAPVDAAVPAPFLVPVREPLPEPLMLPHNFARAGLCSYTSLSGVHEHTDEPAAESDGGVVLADGTGEVRSGLDSAWEASLIDSEPDLAVGCATLQPEEGQEADAALAFPSEEAALGASAESATALGTAFHRLAQQAIERSMDGALFRPDEAAIAAQIQKEDLSAGQQQRLRTALERWLSSDEAARFASFAHRGAEVPFMVELCASAEGVGDTARDETGCAATAPENGPVGEDGALPAPFFLEGEIDGLADNGDGAAFLIDYKTGGSAEETPEALDAKHRLQASCYAYALMRAGYTSVDAHFLRIEHVSATNPRDPQIVPYHFEHTDLPALEALIIQKQQEAFHGA